MGDVRAGIEVSGMVLRYAEVERRDGRYQLLRLGSCEFDFDVVETLRNGAQPEHLDALTEALSDVFEGATAQRLHVALHPPACYSFFTPLSLEDAREQRKQRLLDEAALLTRTTPPQPLRLTADSVYTETLDAGASVEWYHVLALDEQLHARFDRVLRMLPPPQHRMMLSTQAVARAVEQIAREGHGPPRQEAPFTLAVGVYDAHLEFAVCRHARWYFSSFTEAAAPADAGYFGLALVQHLGLQPVAVGELLLYGEEARDTAAASLAAAFGAEPSALDPMQLIDLDANSMAARNHFPAYAPCLGAAF